MTNSAHPRGHENKLFARVWNAFFLVEPASCAHAPQDGSVATGYCLVRLVLQSLLGHARGSAPSVVLHVNIITDRKTVLRDARVDPHEGGLKVKIGINGSRAAREPVSCKFVGFQIR